MLVTSLVLSRVMQECNGLIIICKASIMIHFIMIIQILHPIFFPSVVCASFCTSLLTCTSCVGDSCISPAHLVGLVHWHSKVFTSFVEVGCGSHSTPLSFTLPKIKLLQSFYGLQYLVPIELVMSPVQDLTVYLQWFLDLSFQCAKIICALDFIYSSRGEPLVKLFKWICPHTGLVEKVLIVGCRAAS